MTINPALSDLAPLVGDWRIELSDASFLPDPAARMASSATIGWIEEGSALTIRQGEDGAPPAAVWIVGRDDADRDYQVLYADDRGVSRVYGMAFGDRRWRMWRESADFSQRFEATVDPGGRRITGRWEKSFDGGTSWEHDFRIDYVRVR